MSTSESATPVYDVLIVGAGLAGLTLSQQLLDADPALRICLVHNRRFPNAEKVHKVGESTVEIGAYYLREIVGCGHHLEGDHLRKMGLRFIRTSQTGYREMGLPTYPYHRTYQIDRGRLENHLHERLIDRVTLLETMKAVDTVREEDAYRTCVRDQRGALSTLRSRWIVDASGRGRMLMRKFGLQTDTGIDHSAVWFRLAGKVDINAFMTSERDDDPFRAVPDRSASTTHFVGKGYWVWIIRLDETATSIGIVFDNTLHDLSAMSSHPLAMAWLARHEPRLHAYLDREEFERLDFSMMRNYSYLASCFLSTDQWAVTGEAAGFVDPMYSNGIDLIGLTNTMITNAITGRCDRAEITRMNDLLRDVYHGFIATHRDSLRRFDEWDYLFVKSNWDTTFYFLFMCVLFMNGKFATLDFPHGIYALIKELYALHDEVMTCLRDPERMGRYDDLPDFISLVGSIQDYANRTIVSADRSDAAIIAKLEHNADILRHLAASILERKDFDVEFRAVFDRLDAGMGAAPAVRAA